MKPTLSLVMVVDGNDNGAPNRGDSIAFKIDPPDTPWLSIDVIGKQGAEVVYGAQFTKAHGPAAIELASYAWRDGAADLYARLVGPDAKGKTAILAELNFTVGA